MPTTATTTRRNGSGSGSGSLGSTVLLVAANLLIPVAILVFAAGFFPYKPLLSGLAQFAPLPDYGAPPEPVFDRLVFMVVDALRRYLSSSLTRPPPMFGTHFTWTEQTGG